MAALLTLCVTLVINVPDIREIFGFVGKALLRFTVTNKRFRCICFWLSDFYSAITVLHQDPARREAAFLREPQGDAAADGLLLLLGIWLYLQPADARHYDCRQALLKSYSQNNKKIY